jgi:hypothetical protein
MKRIGRLAMTVFVVLALVVPASAQRFGPQNTGPTFPTNDLIAKSIYYEAMDSSKLPLYAHELLDVVGPRLVGSPGMIKSNDWLISKYKALGIEAKNEKYGEWRGWERGTTHIDLLQPRVRTLEGMMLSWSPPTKKGGITAGLIILADVPDSAAFLKWLPNVKGKFVLVSPPQPTGRPDKVWEEFGTKESFDSLKAVRTRIAEEWQQRYRKTGFVRGRSLNLQRDTLGFILEQSGAAGIVSSDWSGGWGVYRVFGTINEKAPVVALSLEDYSLLYRLVEYGDNPVIRIEADSKFLGPMPAFNTIATIKGSEKPDEYIILSAHLDSWEGASGATDNGTGTILMLETMRIIKKCYPNPKRTIIVGHWGSEEQGLNGSRAFAADHPEVVSKVQAVFNQDNGTGRIQSIGAGGFVNAGEHIARWVSRISDNLTRDLRLSFPGMAWGGGSDHAPFLAAGVPAFGLGSNSWDYGAYTWHTNRDSYDKLVFSDMKMNAALTASLVYQASEDPGFINRDKRIQSIPWPTPEQPERAGQLKKQ